MRIGAAEWAIGLAVGLVLYGILAVSIINSEVSFPERPASEPMPDSVALGMALLGEKEASSPGFVTGAPRSLNRVRTPMSYLLPFEIVSVHLLVVLIGAAYLARAKRRRTPSPFPLPRGGEGKGEGVRPGREQQLGASA
jgi:NADH-quinone oxidoreductase subunit J